MAWILLFLRGRGGARGVMFKEAIAITLGLAALAAVAYVGVQAAGIRPEPPSHIARDASGGADLVCSDYCPIGARTAIPGGL